MKLSFSGDAIQKALIQHVEKIAFGLSLVALVLLLLLGLRVKGVDKTPPELKEFASKTQTNIETIDPWDQIKDSPERVTLTRYSESVKEGNVPTEGGLYAYTQPLNPFVPRPVVKRKDPTLYPPVKVIVHSLNASIAYRNTQGLPDRLGELKTVTVEPQSARSRSRDDRRSRRGFMSMPPGYEDGEFPGMGGDESDAGGGIPFFGEGPPPPGVGGTGSTAGTAGAPKIFRNPVGWRPGGLAGAMGSSMYSGMMSAPPGVSQPPGTTGASSTQQSSPIYIKPSRIMVVLALVEYEKQWDEYKHTFENAVGYNPSRDQPNYLAIAVERAEVPDDPNAPLVWQKIGSTNEAFKEMQQWAGVYDEVAHPLYVLPRTTMPIPPILMREIDDLVIHPEIPRKTQQLPSTSPTSPAGQSPQQPSSPEGDVPSDIPRFGPSGVPGYPMPPGMPGYSGAGGFPASGIPGSGFPAPPGYSDGEGMPGGAAGIGFPSAPPGLGPYGGGAEGDADAAGATMYGAGGMYPGMGMGMGRIASTTKYKLVRFFDLTAEPGKTYRYRVQLLLEDPNHPQDPRLDVAPRMLEDAVASRVADLNSKEPKNGPRQHFYRRTEWSEPSEPVSMERPERFYVGPVVRTNVARHKNGALLVRDPTVMTAAAVLWDPTWGIDVSAKIDVIPGGTLNVNGDLEVVHPLTLEFKKLEKYDLRTHCALVDVRGGDKVGGDSTAPLLAPLEAVFVDAQGQLHVRDEIGDLDRYRRFAFEEDTTQSATGPPGVPGMPPEGMEPDGMAPGGLFPPSGMPGSSGNRPSRARGRGAQNRGS